MTTNFVCPYNNWEPCFKQMCPAYDTHTYNDITRESCRFADNLISPVEQNTTQINNWKAKK